MHAQQRSYSIRAESFPKIEQLNKSFVDMVALVMPGRSNLWREKKELL